MMASTAIQSIDSGVVKDSEISWNYIQTCTPPEIGKSSIDFSFVEEMHKEAPVNLEGLIANLDLSFLEFTLSKYYVNDYHFRFPPIAMMKAIVYYKLKSYQFLTVLFKELLSSDTLADSLGFETIPSYQTFYHFIHTRLGSKGMHEVFDVTIREIAEFCKRKGIKFGDEVALDASPIPAFPNDDDTFFHPHYKSYCYLWHNMRCLDTGLPIGVEVTRSNNRESKTLTPMTLRFIETSGISPARYYLDCGYSSFENFAELKVYWNIDMITNIGKEWIIHEEATLENIKKRYNWYWEEVGYKPGASEHYMMTFLMDKDLASKKVIGRYYRNKMLEWYKRDEKGYKDEYHKRNRIEGTHGLEKRIYQLNHIKARGLEKVSTHIILHDIALLLKFLGEQV